MKNFIFLLCVFLLLCNGCKYFKRPSTQLVDTLKADTVPVDGGVIDSAAYFESVSNVSEPPVTITTKSSTISGKYYMIVGCFTVPTNADRYAEKIRNMGYETQIVPGRDNFKMVAARTYSTYRESVSEIDKFRNEITPNAWVYLKR